jgi:hypothetical protein
MASSLYSVFVEFTFFGELKPILRLSLYLNDLLV